MIKVRIKENSWIAAIAAKKLGYARVALVIGKTIYLHNTMASHFLNNKRWLIHELKHVEQFEVHGFFGFLVKYLVEYIRKGYYKNKFEIEARAAENDSRLLHKYEVWGNVS